MNWSPEDANFLKFASERELTPAAFPAYSPTPPLQHMLTILKNKCWRF